MALLTNIAAGALLATACLGPTTWADIVQVNGRLVQAASQLAGTGEASPLTHAVAKARGALPHGAH
jgi:hypothetical protein